MHFGLGVIASFVFLLLAVQLCAGSCLGWLEIVAGQQLPPKSHLSQSGSAERRLRTHHASFCLILCSTTQLYVFFFFSLWYYIVPFTFQGPQQEMCARNTGAKQKNQLWLIFFKKTGLIRNRHNFPLCIYSKIICV